MASERQLVVEVDSAGTGDYHVGELPDPRVQKVGAIRGCAMTMRARQFRSSDFEDYDLIVVMDQTNHRDVLRWPGARSDKVRMATSFIPESAQGAVPDPYYGGLKDFEEVATMLETVCSEILDRIDV
jgi:protein-tyrosine phosphatase